MSRMCALIVADDHVRAKRDVQQAFATRYVIDHDTHLKMCGPVPRLRRAEWIEVLDQTQHFDEEYWRLLQPLVLYALRNGHDLGKVLAILTHYLHNALLDDTRLEAAHLEKLAANRRWIDLTMTDEEAHGWELDALRKAGLL